MGRSIWSLTTCWCSTINDFSLNQLCRHANCWSLKWAGMIFFSSKTFGPKVFTLIFVSADHFWNNPILHVHFGWNESGGTELGISNLARFGCFAFFGFLTETETIKSPFWRSPFSFILKFQNLNRRLFKSYQCIMHHNDCTMKGEWENWLVQSSNEFWLVVNEYKFEYYKYQWFAQQ